jgi:two-component system cell cycle response regulator
VAERNRTLSSGQIVAPMLFGVVSIGLLVYGSTPINPWCRTLAAASLTVVLVRLAITFRDYAQAVEKREREAMTDALTGLANRRALTADLETLVRDLRADEPAVLTILDLDGFKAYNDTFGHPAGDAMLVRLSAKLATSVAGRGRAYRMGGDEFCVIARCASGETADATQRAAAALSEDGEGFSVRSSFGAVRMPAEAHTAETALQTADQRMYDSKGLVRSSAQGQSRAVLVAALTERTPELSSHTQGVRELAESVARRLGMNPGEIDVVGNTADLHDIGKIAIPRAILDKPGPLDEGEWSLMRGHTVIGERIVGAAPALADVAAAVRASHERWDGAGYPDGLVGEMTPLAARIVCVCDAFDAMIADRPYASPRTTDEAIEELRRCSGTQFDPAVVQAFCTTIAARGRTPPGIASSVDQALTHGFSDR